MKTTRNTALIFSIGLLAACGGGGGGGGGGNTGPGGPGGPIDTLQNWTDAALISAANGSQRDAASVIAADGTATFVWVQNFAGDNEVFSRRLSIDSENPVDSIEKISSSANAASTPNAVVDSLGNVTVAWMDVDANELSVFANRFDANTGVWLGPVVVETFNDSATPPLIAINDAGQVAVSYTIADRTLYFSAYNAGNNTWATPVSVATVANPRTLSNAALAHAANNVWLLAYTDADPSAPASSVRLGRVNAAASPATSSVIDIASGTGTTLFTAPALATLTNGDAAVVFNRFSLTGFKTTLQARVRQNDGSLTPVFTLDDSHLGPLPNVKAVALGMPGNQFQALWFHFDMEDTNAREGLVLRHFDSTGAASLSALHFAHPAEQAASPQDFDALAQGNHTLLVWQASEDAQPDNELNLWESRFLEGSGWDVPSRVENDAREASEPGLAGRGDQTALITWLAGPGGASQVLFAERCPAGNTAQCD